MKYVFLAIFVLIAAQPMQASACDMHNAQETSQNESHNMHGDPMHDGDGPEMDCCDHDPSISIDQCEVMSHCGACTAGVVSIDSFTASAVFSIRSHQSLPDTGEPLNRFNSPPFRPPIA